jgi:hypothetical protein
MHTTTTADRRGRLRLTALAAILVLALAPAACGGGDDNGGETDSGAAGTAASYGASAPAGSEAAAVEASFIAITEHMAAGEWEQACAAMTPAAQRTFTGGQDCVEALESVLTPEQDTAERPKIVEVEVTGDEAVLVVRSDDRRRTVPFAKRRSRWKVSGETVAVD